MRILAVLSLILTSFVAALAADTVTVRKEVYVKGAKVLLGDVADIEGDSAKALAAIEVATAPLPGGTKRLDATFLASRLRGAGIESGDSAFKGASCVLVKMAAIEVTPEMIGDDLRRFIESQMPWEPVEATIDVVPPQQDVTVAEGAVTFQWKADPRFRWLGSGAFRGDLCVDGDVKRTIQCRATVEAYREVMAAAADIPRGKTISLTDLRPDRRPLSTLQNGYFLNAEELVDYVAKAAIPPGEIIAPRHVAAKDLVKRNQQVSVETRVSGLLIRNVARALGNAREGDVVACMNEDSKQQFQGVVRKDGVVQVD